MFSDIFKEIDKYVNKMSESKIFIGIIVIILNVSSKFVNIKLSKTMESYLKHTFSRQILVFAMCFMGSRSIWIALFVSTIFVICVDYLFNEESYFCILPKHFTEHHINMFDNGGPDKTTLNKTDLENAVALLAKAQTIINESGLNIIDVNNSLDSQNSQNTPDSHKYDTSLPPTIVSANQKQITNQTTYW
jgi:hypothetical protein